MTHRELPRSEWHRLDGTDLELLRHPQMEKITRVLVVENEDGQIVGHWALVNWWHAEGLGISEAYRSNPAVARHLLSAMRHLASEVRASVVYTAADDGEAGATVRQLLEHVHATPIPGQAYFLPVLR